MKVEQTISNGCEWRENLETMNCIAIQPASNGGSQLTILRTDPFRTEPFTTPLRNSRQPLNLIAQEGSISSRSTRATVIRVPNSALPLRAIFHRVYFLARLIKTPLRYMILILALSPFLSEANESDNFTKTFFYQFFTEARSNVASAIFRKEIFLSEVPEGARNQTFSLRKKGDDYLLGILTGTNESTAAMYAGAYKGRSWELINNNLTLSDPTINQSITPISALEGVTRMTLNLLLNLGITELIRASLVWDDNKYQFVARSTDGKELIIGFEYTNQLPMRAIIRNAVDGREFAYVDYEYSGAICKGELPFRFTRHSGSMPHVKKSLMPLIFR